MKLFKSALLTLAVTGSLAITPWAFAADTNNETTRTESTVKSTNDVTKTTEVAPDPKSVVDKQAAADVRMRISEMVNKSLEKNGFNDVVNHLTKTQRESIQAEKYKDFEKLNASIEHFRKAFSEKYTQEFNLSPSYLNDVSMTRGANDDHVLVSFLSIYDSAGNVKTPIDMDPPVADRAHNNSTKRKEVNNPAIVDAAGNVVGVTTNPAVTPSAPEANKLPSNAPRTADAANDAAKHPRKAAEISFIREDKLGNGWKLQASRPTTAAQLADSLAMHLDKLTAMKAEWPTDAKAAQLIVSKKILMTLDNGIIKDDVRKQAASDAVKE